MTTRWWVRALPLGLLLVACTKGGTSEPPPVPPATGATGLTAEATGPAEGSSIPSTARCYAVMTDAPGKNGILLFGGWSEPQSDDGVWQGVSAFRPNAGWTEVAETPHGGGDAFAFDARAGRAVSLEVGGGTWAFDPVAATWEELLEEAPPAYGSRMIYDAGSERLVLFGGYDADEVLTDETWAFDDETDTWTKMDPRRSPEARSFFGMAYDDRADRVIVFGGSGSAGDLGDTWAYDVDTDAWTRLARGGGPEPRVYPTLAYDRINDRVILFGGVTGGSEEPQEDTWAFDLATNTWTRLDVTGPSARGWHVMAADAESGDIVLFGGGSSREACTDETWLFDPSTSEWSRVG